MLAGYELVDVASEGRAIEIAARLSAVPGPGGVLLQQPIGARCQMPDLGTNFRRPSLAGRRL
jgi:hypothetical protein